MPHEPTIVPATLDDYQVIQNLAKFYTYDMSRNCGDLPDWQNPADGMFECFDLRHYFEDENRYPFLVKVGEELAGFVMIHTHGTSSDTAWVVGEFFITAKFQGKRIGARAAIDLFNRFPGIWESSAIPENTPAIQFWRKVIMEYSDGHFEEETHQVQGPHDHKSHPMIVWTFRTV